MFKKLYFLTFVSILFNNLSYAENLDKSRMIETCA